MIKFYLEQRKKAKLTIGPTSCRGPERRTLPKKVSSVPRVECRENSRTGSQTAEKQLFGMLRVFFFPVVFRLFSRRFIYTGPTRHFSRLFSRSGVLGLCSWSGRPNLIFSDAFCVVFLPCNFCSKNTTLPGISICRCATLKSILLHTCTNIVEFNISLGTKTLTN